MKTIILANQKLSDFLSGRFSNYPNIEVISTEQYGFDKNILIPRNNFKKVFDTHKTDEKTNFLYILHSSDFFPKEYNAGVIQQYCTENRTVITYHKDPHDNIYKLLVCGEFQNEEDFVKQILSCYETPSFLSN